MFRKFTSPLALGAILIALSVAPSAEGGIAVIGWQTFDNFTDGNNNSGINDGTPDTNSTFDATPYGSNVNNWYLTGTIGPNASNIGRKGLGQATNNTFLNGATFGSDLNIVDYTLADGRRASGLAHLVDPGRVAGNSVITMPGNCRAISRSPMSATFTFASNTFTLMPEDLLVPRPQKI